MWNPTQSDHRRHSWQVSRGVFNVNVIVANDDAHNGDDNTSSDADDRGEADNEISSSFTVDDKDNDKVEELQ